MKTIRMRITSLLLVMSLAATAQQADSTFRNTAALPSKFISQVNNKIDKYYSRISSKTTRTLEKLANWENKIHSLLQKASPETAARLFANDQMTFAFLLEKYRQGELIADNYREEYNEYADKLNTSFKYLEAEKDELDPKIVKPVKAANEKIRKLQNEENREAAIRQFIKARKKQLLDQSLQYIGKSKYLKKINKEAYYYVETLRNYKELFQDEKKAEETALNILNKIPAFRQFVRENSMLASIFRIPGNPGTANALSLAGLQTRAGVNAMIQDRIAAGGPNAQQMILQNMQEAQSQLQQLKDKIMKAGGSSSDAAMPDFKPNSQKTKTFWQRLEFGSNLQFAKPSGFLPTTADIALSLGYKPNDKSVIGIGASYKMGLGSFQHLSISHQGIGLRSFVDWKIRKQFFLSGGFEMNYNARFQSIRVLQDYKSWQQAGLIGLSKKINIKTKWFRGSKLQLLYDLLANQHVPVSQPVVFRVGYVFR